MPPPPDELSWSVRVGASSKDRGTVYARSHQVEVGPRVPIDEKAAAISALELVLGALGADLATGILAAAARRRVEIERAEAVVTGWLQNPLAHLGVIGETGHPGLEAVSVVLYISSLAPPEDVEGAWKEALERSPLYHTFQRLVTLDIRTVPTP